MSDVHVIRVLVTECAKPHRLSAYSALEISNLVSSIGKLARDTQSSFRGIDAILSEVMRPPRLESFTGAQLRMVIYAAGSLSPQAQQWLGPLVMEVRQPHRLRELNTQDLANVLLSMVHARCNDADFFHLIASELAQRQSPFSMGSSFAKAVHAANCSAYKEVGQAIMSVVTPVCGEQQFQADLSGEALCFLLHNLFKWCSITDCDTNAVQNLIVSLSKLLATPHILNDVQSSHLEKLLAQFGSQSFCDHEAVDPVVRQVTSSESLRRMTASDLLVTFRVVTRLRLKRSAEYGSAITLHMLDHGLLSTYTCDQLVDVMGILSAVGCTDRRSLDAVFQELSKPENVMRLHPSDWARVMESVTWAGAG